MTIEEVMNIRVRVKAGKNRTQKGEKAHMTKAELIEEVSRVVEMTRKDSEVIVEAIFDSIVQSLRSGDKIEIRGFGSFRTTAAAAARGAQSENRHSRGSALQTHPLLQAQQGTEGPGEHLREQPMAAPAAPARPPSGGKLRTACNRTSQFMDHLWSPWRYQYVQKEKTGDGCVFCQAAAAGRDEENLVVHRAEELRHSESLSLQHRPSDGGSL